MVTLEEHKRATEAIYAMQPDHEAMPLAMIEAKENILVGLAAPKETWLTVLAGLAKEAGELKSISLTFEAWALKLESELDGLVAPSEHPGRKECVVIMVTRRGEKTETTTGILHREDEGKTTIEWLEEQEEFDSWLADGLEDLVG